MFIAEDSQPSLTRCRFEANDAWWGTGGGISCYDFDGTLTDCVFLLNTSNQGGAGMGCSRSEPLLVGCEFYENSIQYYGGGFEAFNQADPQLIDCTFAGNWAGEAGGGAVVWNYSSASFQNCTFAQNSSPSGGGLRCDMVSSIMLLNSVVAFSVSGEGISCDATSNVTLNCCDVFGNEGGDWVGCIASQNGITGNISEDPLFCGEHNPDQPYTLDDESPCSPQQYPCGQIGAWPIGCQTTHVANPAPDPVSGFTAHSCFPNPFNPATVIRFTIPTVSPVRLSIVDLSGKVVAELINCDLSAGEHEITWHGIDDQGRPVSSGIYFYRLVTNSDKAIKRMALVR
jgi:predicted outer membrane repeat protein